MPKTAFQKAIFGALMALAMVYGMEVYNALVRNGGFSGTSLVAVALFKGLDPGLVSKWTSTTLLNLPMAFGWQLLVAGPLVRLLFRKLFAPQAQPSERG